MISTNMETFKNNLCSQLWNMDMRGTVPIPEVTHKLQGEAKKKSKQKCKIQGCLGGSVG